MTELVRVDGVTVSLDDHDRVIWLAVVDGAGTHSTSLTPEGAEAVMAALVVARRVQDAKEKRP